MCYSSNFHSRMYVVYTLHTIQSHLKIEIEFFRQNSVIHTLPRILIGIERKKS